MDKDKKIDELEDEIQKLSAELFLYRQIIKSAPVSIFAKNLNKEHILSNEFNNISLRLYESEVLGKTNDEIFPPNIAKEINDIDDRILAGEKQVVKEDKIMSPEGELYFLATRVPFYNEKGDIAGIFGISQNITQLKRYQNKIEKNENIRKINTLVQGLSHDLNNFITSISNNLELLRYESLSANQKEIINDIQNTVGLTSKMFDDVTKFGERTKDHKVKNVKIEEILAEVKKLVNLSKFENIEFHQNLNAKIVKLSMDRRHLIQIFMNIILNAIEAMMGVGEISIETNILQKDKLDKIEEGKLIDASNQWLLELKISDSGPGISEQVMNNIFNPYFSTKSSSNSGLGLYIAYSIIKEYDGNIEVETQEGIGSSFIVTLPIEF